MVQEFHVLRCFSCEVFQVQQVKSVNKWLCKVCGVKQSVLKEYGRGSGADCRRHVQKLNSARGAKMEEEAESRAKMDAQACQKETALDEERQLSHKSVSRWDKYLPAPQEEVGLTHEGVEPEEEAVLLDRDLLYSSTQRVEKRGMDCGQQWKRRRTSDKDVSGPGRSSTRPHPQATPPHAVSKWSSFLGRPSASESGSRVSTSSMFQSGEDLDLNWT
ncbi:MRN complex-interacting protein [Eucyclogobius newberryi]|uniref:MRN complex-interacting protein n=1 Tax=Eucyclogobius newberryi TaxID=166745 RepID=UPI003B5B4872